ncbi:hypothetical protein GCM10010215_25800 [Streptomyces virginiae]|uniref:Uncharacterized protein n=1 Tax=Streptomyces virginiae TaxID=1961 RepID=A0ABQ3NN96_STRVG|nr:hypothetical protein GCM10010215_25800 [Streptomyces virginiae]GHI14241.1 hypothetical protein Scinn_37040 [Streptomyces virginiae]
MDDRTTPRSRGQAQIILAVSPADGLVAVPVGEQYPWANTTLQLTPGFERRPDGTYALRDVDTAAPILRALADTARRHRVHLFGGPRTYLGDYAAALADDLPEQCEGRGLRTPGVAGRPRPPPVGRGRTHRLRGCWPPSKRHTEGSRNSTRRGQRSSTPAATATAPAWTRPRWRIRTRRTRCWRSSAPSRLGHTQQQYLEESSVEWRRLRPHAAALLSRVRPVAGAEDSASLDRLHQLLHPDVAEPSWPAAPSSPPALQPGTAEILRRWRTGAPALLRQAHATRPVGPASTVRPALPTAGAAAPALPGDRVGRTPRSR